MKRHRIALRVRVYLSQSALLFGLATGFGAGLGMAQLHLSPRIAANKRAETTDQIPRLLPGAVTGQPTEVGGRPVFRGVDSEGAPAGWVLPCQGPGFAGPIELLVGLNPDRTEVTAVYVLAQSETPGLGNRITDPAWLTQFDDHPTDVPFHLGPGGIDGLTGATISSRAVVEIANAARRQFTAITEDAP